ncbi:MAG: VCBS repeat-containing protein, partial [Acidimicrobiia bacterium]|nr:VCBS repeat-containing protein [Acidimicrobiia bacterium]
MTRAWVLVVGLTLAVVALFVGVRALVDSGETQAAAAPPSFVEEATAAGLEHVYDGEFTFFVGGGVAVFDCNDDAKPDLYLAGGANPAALYRNESKVGGALRFEAVPGPPADLTKATGAYPLDIDGDGITDLAVLRLGENVLLRGLGGCRFERANEAWGFDGGSVWTTAFSAKWEGAAALPTLALGNFVALDETGGRAGGCSDNTLVRPAEAGYGSPIPLTPGWCTLSILFSDWDRSGRGDLRITNDRQYYRDGEEQLWRIADGEPIRLLTRDDGWEKLQIFGMGIASHDVTGDGLPELFLTNMGDNKLQTLSEDADRPTYTDIAFESGVTAHRPFIGDNVMPSTAWHAEFQDINNDSFIDLFVTKGNVDAMSEFAAADPNNLLLGQADGTFIENAEAAGVLSLGRSRGAALVDFNLDGMLDLVEVNRRDNVKVWRSVGWGDAGRPLPMDNWLAIELNQTGPNGDAIGSWVEVRVGARTMT